MKRLVAVLAVLALAVGACGADDTAQTVLAAQSEDGPPRLAGYELEPDPAVGNLSLPAVNRGGDDFAFRADPGEILMVYFMFTNCPDFCPTTLADTRIALNILGERAAAVDVAAVTIDPARDTDQILTDYVETFIADGIALRTDDQKLLNETTFAFGADYRIITNDDGEIEVGHTTNMFAVDDTGSVVVTWPFGVTTDDIANDLTILLDRAEGAA